MRQSHGFTKLAQGEQRGKQVYEWQNYPRYQGMKAIPA
jgi:hypothetical protein